MVIRMQIAKDFIISKKQLPTQVFKICELSRSSFYYKKKSVSYVDEKNKQGHKKGRPIPGFTLNRDGQIINDYSIVTLLCQYRNKLEYMNAYGVTKLTYALRRDFKIYVNKKKIYRLCDDNKLLLPKRPLQRKGHLKRVSVNVTVTRKNQLWQFDIKYGYIQGEKRFFFILAFVDVFSRKCVGKYVGLQCKSGDLVFTLNQALIDEGVRPEDNLMLRSDNGPQMSSNGFFEHLKKLEIKLSHEFIPVRTPNKNAHVESFFSILELELLRVVYFKSFSEAYIKVHAFIVHYNQVRIHSSLGYRTPNEVVAILKANKECHVEEVKC